MGSTGSGGSQIPGNRIAVDGAKKALRKAEAAKLKGMGEEPANCSDPAAEILAGNAAELFLNSLLLAYDLTK